MIAVWLVGPPFSVTSARTIFASRPAVSAGARSSATRIDGSSASGTPGSASPTSVAVSRFSMSRRSVTRSAIRPPIEVNSSANCSTEAPSADRRGSPALTLLTTAERSPLSRVRPAVAVSTSAAEPLAFSARPVRRSATRVTAPSYASIAASSSSASLSKASMACWEIRAVATITGP
jgi:hypothetical protein